MKMNERTIEMDSVPIQFSINDDIWQLKLAKSQTHVKDIRQLALITEKADNFVPAQVEDGEDIFTFSFIVDSKVKKWEDVLKLSRSDKLRLLCNISRFEKALSTRMTFFLHPENLVFDDNLLPSLVYRGIRDLVPPFELDKDKFVLQYKCLVVALFSKKYTFDELYSGSLKNARDTEFEREIGETEDLNSLINLLEASYLQEKDQTDRNMQVVPKKRFRLFKQLTITMIIVSVILAVPLAYFSFGKVPFQNHLLEAHRHFLATDYGQVISEMQGEEPEKIPVAGKYVLAYSYIKSEKLSDEQKGSIMKNISMKSDENYLLYWIYNGRGDFDKSIDLAMYIDDPQLIMYGLIKQIERTKNDPDMTGSEREEEVQKYQEQLAKYTEEYGTDSLQDSQTSGSVTEDEKDVVEEQVNPDVVDQGEKQETTTKDIPNTEKTELPKDSDTAEGKEQTEKKE